MNKIIGISLAGIVVVGVMGFLLISGNDNKAMSNGECAQLCSDAKAVCPSLIDLGTCENNCPNFSQGTIDHLKNSNSCEELTKNPELISEVLIPNNISPEQNKTSTDCEAACANYVNKCLTLVPNADQSLFQEGLNSCMDECVNYNYNKVNCLINAIDCPAMTEQCGL